MTREDTLVRMAAGKWLWEAAWQTGAGRRHHAQPATHADPPRSLASGVFDDCSKAVDLRPGE